jgi:hypothetical protein
MPNRIIREGILTSERVDQLDPAAEVFYRRLMSKVDDHGLYDARPSILRTSLYPLRVDRVREADISRSLAACQSAGLIALYQHDGKPYLQMLDTRWQARSEAKYPLPAEANGEQPKAPANTCAQVPATAPVFGVGDGVVKPPHPPAGGAFGVFWNDWPEHPRKAAKAQCLRKWHSAGCEPIADQVLAALAAAKQSEAWAKNGGEFIPAPLVWLNQARWEAPIKAVVNGSAAMLAETAAFTARMEKAKAEAVPMPSALRDRFQPRPKQATA